MKISDINIRDPFVLVHDGKYYLYGTRGASCWGPMDGFDCYISDDLENFSDAAEIFHKPDDFWADMNYWAPEVHLYNGKFYMFASFYAKDKMRGTQILIADRPEGPFRLHSDGPVTPKDWMCLDGTFYVSKDGTPYIVFAHEWVQIAEGTMCALELTKDLKAAVGEPKLLFGAAEASAWIVPFETDRLKEDCYVTDGPFMYRAKNGELLMIWSSYGKTGYVQATARSSNGDIDGVWTQDKELLFEKDGGHGMLFTDLNGQLKLALHSPNEHLLERPVFYDIDDTEGKLKRRV